MKKFPLQQTFKLKRATAKSTTILMVEQLALFPTHLVQKQLKTR